MEIYRIACVYFIFIFGVIFSKKGMGDDEISELVFSLEVLE